MTDNAGIKYSYKKSSSLATHYYGLSSNDVFSGTKKADIFNGGGGDDAYYVNHLSDVVNENENDGFDYVFSTVSYSLNNYIENLTLQGKSNINATGNQLNNILIGNSGKNVLNGAGGADTMMGGNGNDTYIVDNIADSLVETNSAKSGGVDLVKSNVNFTLGANFENLTLVGTEDSQGIGNNLKNTITGNTGNNILDGKGGVDKLIGGLGNDTYYLDIIQTGKTLKNLKLVIEDDVVETANGGNDTVFLRVGTVSNIWSFEAYATLNIPKHLENLNLSLTGMLNFDLYGNNLDNILVGNDAGNSLLGGEGNDQLNGGLGNDTLTGGRGSDIFILDSSSSNSFDYIKDFTIGLDKIDITSLDKSGVLSQGIYTDMFMFGKQAELVNQHIIYDKPSGELYFDANGVLHGQKVLIAKFSSNFDLSQQDFLNALQISQPANKITGTNLPDTLNGTNLNETIFGLNGGDLMLGGVGDDILYGNLGQDVLDGGIGVDIMVGGADSDTYYVDNSQDIVVEKWFRYDEAKKEYFRTYDTNTVYSSVTYTVDVGVSNLTLTGNANINGFGNIHQKNVITGNIGDNILFGGLTTTYASEPSNFGFDGMISDINDTLIGGAGNDTYYYSDAQYTIVENADEGVDTLIITGANFYFDKPKVFLTEEPPKPDWSINAMSLISAISEVENYVLYDDTVLVEHMIGSVKDNLIVGNIYNNRLYGMNGNDELKGLGGDDNLYGGGGNDKLWGGNGRDVFYLDDFGTEYSDIIYDFVSGVDKIQLPFRATSVHGIYLDMFISSTGANVQAQDENDYYVYNQTTGELYYDADGNGVDTKLLLASLLPNTMLLQSDFVDATNIVMNLVLTGTNNGESIIGAFGNDKLYGLGGNDLIDGKGGDDSILGGDGNDTLIGGLGNNHIDGGTGIDTVDYSSSKAGVIFQLSSTFGVINDGGLDKLVNIENVIGTNSWDSINGDDLDNTIFGLAKDDDLRGGLGNDVLIGGTGDDSLDGGLDADTFRWELVDKGTNGNASLDKITDFSLSHHDALDLGDLLVGEANASGNLLNYLDIAFNAGNTEIHISTNGGFIDGNYNPTNENARINLLGVDLFASIGQSSESALLQNLISNNHLRVD